MADEHIKDSATDNSPRETHTFFQPSKGEGGGVFQAEQGGIVESPAKGVEPEKAKMSVKERLSRFLGALIGGLSVFTIELAGAGGLNADGLKAFSAFFKIPEASLAGLGTVGIMVGLVLAILVGIYLGQKLFSVPFNRPVRKQFIVMAEEDYTKNPNSTRSPENLQEQADALRNSLKSIYQAAAKEAEEAEEPEEPEEPEDKLATMLAQGEADYEKEKASSQNLSFQEDELSMEEELEMEDEAERVTKGDSTLNTSLTESDSSVASLASDGEDDQDTLTLQGS